MHKQVLVSFIYSFNL